MGDATYVYGTSVTSGPDEKNITRDVRASSCGIGSIIKTAAQTKINDDESIPFRDPETLMERNQGDFIRFSADTPFRAAGNDYRCLAIRTFSFGTRFQSGFTLRFLKHFTDR